MMNSQHQRHRNIHPDDTKLFTGQQLISLQRANYELCWLLNRGYTRQSALQLVADHHQLRQRQRQAIARTACSDQSLNNRQNKSVKLEAIKNQDLIIDGFNLIITLEVALADSLLLQCRDGCIRDLASIHGTYRLVAETPEVITMIGRTLASYQPKQVLWLFDKPVSNSGRLADLVRTIAEIYDWKWQVQIIGLPHPYTKWSNIVALKQNIKESIS